MVSYLDVLFNLILPLDFNLSIPVSQCTGIKTRKKGTQSFQLDTLKASTPARIINVSSGIHVREKRMPFDDLGITKGYRGFKAYGRSKLANVLFTCELARLLEGTGVTANAANPGFSATGPGMQADRGFGPVMRRVVSMMAKTAVEGARTIIYLASSPDVEGVTGKYFENSEPVESSPASNDIDAARRLWEINSELASNSD